MIICLYPPPSHAWEFLQSLSACLENDFFDELDFEFPFMLLHASLLLYLDGKGMLISIFSLL